MIDRAHPEKPGGRPAAVPPAAAGRSASGAPSDSLSDLYSDLFSEPNEPAAAESNAQAAPHSEEDAAAATAPRTPFTLADTGLGLMHVCDLILKQLYLQGNLLGIQFARHARLPFPVIDEGLKFLKEEKCIEVSSGELIGPASYRFNLTELGRRRAREAFDQCRYVGPAPVPLEAYVEQCRRQTVAGTACSMSALSDAFGQLILRQNLLQELGPAVCSGKSIFVYGPPGNGKTMIAKGLGNFLNTHGGDIYVPYAFLAENSIITVFDPTIHRPTDNTELQALNLADPEAIVNPGDISHSRTLPAPSFDLRWRRVRRPVVITGGELTLEMLDLRFNESSNFYTAPLHIKANCGVFLIDDFGRQIVSPRDLLNRWILPLEERIDFLTLTTGKKFAVPFEQLIVFSTNLDPRELVDEAFLRRIRHKIHIGPPDRELFTEIFQMNCEIRDIKYNPGCVDFLYSHYYSHNKSPRSSDPRDLLEITQSICRFRKQPVLLTPELIAEAAERFFVEI